MNVKYSSRLSKIDKILKDKLPDIYEESWKDSFFDQLPRYVPDNFIAKLIIPCKKLVELGGKRWRPLLLVLCAEMAAEKNGGSEANIETAYQLTPLIEFVHNASLIHDDIEDNSDMRRGKPAAHIVYGTDVALNSGTWLYFAASQCISDINASVELKNHLYETYLTELRRLHLGQAMDIEWHRQKDFIPSSDEYFAMTQLKTGTLASLAAKIGILAGGGSYEEASLIGSYAAKIGIGFQILDDIINLTTGNKGKKRGDDIVEGKKSLPLILHLQNKPGDLNKIIKYFKKAEKEGPSSKAVENCIELLNSTDAIEKALDISRQLIKETCAQISDRYNNSESAELVTKLFTSMLI